MSVPQSYVLKTRRNEAEKRLAKKMVERLEKSKAVKREQLLKRTEQYEKEYEKMERDLITKRREAHNNLQFFVEGEGRLAVVTRIRGINQISPKVKKILRLLRLRQIHNTVFVRLNKATLEMLRLVEPFIAYGYPNLKTIRHLVYKRGFGKVQGQRIPLMENEQVEASLGRFGIKGVEDLVHELYTVGPHFKEANNFLWPFKLSSPNGGFSKKLRHFNEGGEYGNHEVLIGKLINRMI